MLNRIMASPAIKAATPIMFAVIAVALLSEPAFAQTLPTPPSDLGGDDGNWFAVIGKAILKAAPTLLIGLIIAVGLWVGWMLISALNEWRNGRIDAGTLSGRIFTFLVIMALVTIISVWTLNVVTTNQSFLGGA